MLQLLLAERVTIRSAFSVAETTCGLSYNYCWQRESNQVSIQCGWDYLWVVLQLLPAEREKEEESWSEQYSVWLRQLFGCVATSSGRVMTRSVSSTVYGWDYFWVVLQLLLAERECGEVSWSGQYSVWFVALLGYVTQINVTISACKERSKNASTQYGLWPAWVV